MLEKIFILFSGLLSQVSAAQQVLPKDYFHSPIDTFIFLAGNFGELRPNHFHAGIDIKTYNREGLPVHASADGFVSRIKVSAFGYGKVIYVTHPNGFVTVYGHLSAYTDSIGAYVKRQQYAQKKFEIELFPKRGEFPVKQGEVIAFSGNTGNSGGPHVHFEIRDEKTEVAINPLLFGLPVLDKRKPQVTHVKLYPADAGGLINGLNKAMEFVVAPGKVGYMLVLPEPIRISGNIYFGLEAFDSEIAGGGKNGVFSVSLFINNRRIYAHEMDRIGFDESRAINSFIEYPDYVRKGQFYMRSYVEPNNKLGIYKFFSNRGLFHFDSDSTYTVKYILKDVSGNTSSLEFKVRSGVDKGSLKTLQGQAQEQKTSPVFHYGLANNFETDNFKISLPANVLYDDIVFHYSRSVNHLPGCFPQVYQVHSALVPVHDFFTISILSPEVRDSLKRHLFIARINKSGHPEFAGAKREGTFITASVREFGEYVVALDTIPPTIQVLRPGSVKSGNHPKTLEFRILDNLSGINGFEAFMDDKWVLMEYEYKQNKLYYTIDTKPGKHNLVLRVWDKAGNTRIYRSIFGI